MYAVIIFMTIIIFGLTETAYNRYMMDYELGDSLPFGGFISMYKHRDAIANWGAGF